MGGDAAAGTLRIFSVANFLLGKGFIQFDQEAAMGAAGLAG
jgi:hypothetical protein